MFLTTITVIIWAIYIQRHQRKSVDGNCFCFLYIDVTHIEKKTLRCRWRFQPSQHQQLDSPSISCGTNCDSNTFTRLCYRAFIQFHFGHDFMHMKPNAVCLVYFFSIGYATVRFWCEASKPSFNYESTCLFSWGFSLVLDWRPPFVNITFVSRSRFGCDSGCRIFHVLFCPIRANVVSWTRRQYEASKRNKRMKWKANGKSSIYCLYFCVCVSV